MITTDSLFFATFVSALIDILSFFLFAWGAIMVLWGSLLAIRRVFWIEAEPWKGPQVPMLEDARLRLSQRVLIGLLFFLAGMLLRFLVDMSLSALLQVGVLVGIIVLLNIVVLRDIRMFEQYRMAPSRTNTNKRTPVRVTD